MEALSLVVPSIGCQGCMKKIVNTLQTLPGIEIVETNVPTKSLVLRYAPQEISPEQIEHAVRTLGHRIAPKDSALTEKLV